LSIVDCELPIADCELPIVDCELPIVDCELPIVDCVWRLEFRFVVRWYSSTIVNRQSAIDNLQSSKLKPQA